MNSADIALKVEALRLATASMSTADLTVTRAATYYRFLKGGGDK